MSCAAQSRLEDPDAGVFIARSPSLQGPLGALNEVTTFWGGGGGAFVRFLPMLAGHCGPGQRTAGVGAAHRYLRRGLKGPHKHHVVDPGALGQRDDHEHVAGLDRGRALRQREG